MSERSEGTVEHGTVEPTHDVRLRVNGVPRAAAVPARRLLSDFLRHDLGLTGTHVGCEHGVCGACTVLVDGAPVRSCLLFAVSVDGADVTTVEGCRRPDGDLGPVQQAFVECHGLQCGFCTPGFVTTITAYLEENPKPTEEEAREAIAGNLCRCTGYQNIVAAVLRAAELLRSADEVGSPTEDPADAAADAVAGDATDAAADAAAAAAHGGRPAGGSEPTGSAEVGS